MKDRVPMSTLHHYRLGCDVGFAPVGCFEDFMDVPRPVANYEHNERDDTIPGFNGIYIDWNNWNNYYKEMICRCAKKARKNNHEIFSIQYWGKNTSFYSFSKLRSDGQHFFANFSIRNYFRLFCLSLNYRLICMI